MRRRLGLVVLVAVVVTIAGVTPSVAELSAAEPRVGDLGGNGPSLTFAQENNSTVQLARQGAIQAADDAADGGANVSETERQAAVSGAVWAVSNGYVNNSEQTYQAAYGASYGALIVEGASTATIANAVAGGVIGGTYYQATGPSVVIYAAAGATQQATQTATFDDFGRFRPPIPNSQFILAASAGSTAGGIQGARSNESVSLTRILIGTQTGAFEALSEAIASPNYTVTEIFGIAEDESFTFVSGIGDAGDSGTAGPPDIPRGGEQAVDTCPPFCAPQPESDTTTDNSTTTGSLEPQSESQDRTSSPVVIEAERASISSFESKGGFDRELHSVQREGTRLIDRPRLLDHR